MSLGRWQESALPSERFDNMGAFGSDAMCFEQWLQFILVPRIESIVEQKDALPPGSMTAVYAVRYFDGDDQASRLITLLGELDEIINQNPPL